jgi:hypothetical protein
MWIPSHDGIQGNNRADVLAKEGPISETLFHDQAGLITANTSDNHTHAKTRLLLKWQEGWNGRDMGRYCRYYPSTFRMLFLSFLNFLALFLDGFLRNNNFLTI